MQLGSGIVVAVAVAGSCSSDSTPRLGTSICCGCSPKKPKEKKKHISALEEEISHCGSVLTNPTSILEDAGSIPGLAQWVKDPVLL